MTAAGEGLTEPHIDFIESYIGHRTQKIRIYSP
jgi:hypothetical protein